MQPDCDDHCNEHNEHRNRCVINTQSLAHSAASQTPLYASLSHVTRQFASWSSLDEQLNEAAVLCGEVECNAHIDSCKRMVSLGSRQGVSVRRVLYKRDQRAAEDILRSIFLHARRDSRLCCSLSVVNLLQCRFVKIILGLLSRNQSASFKQ